MPSLAASRTKLNRSFMRANTSACRSQRIDAIAATRATARSAQEGIGKKSAPHAPASAHRRRRPDAAEVRLRAMRAVETSALLRVMRSPACWGRRLAVSAWRWSRIAAEVRVGSGRARYGGLVDCVYGVADSVLKPTARPDLGRFATSFVFRNVFGVS